MIFWYFMVIIALIWLIFATITDIKKREVSDWLNYSLIIIGLGSRSIYSIITKEPLHILYGLLGLAIFFIVANFMYYTKQWGGGDAKLLMGLGAMFGNFNSLNLLNIDFQLPFLLVLIINILIAGTIYGLIYSLVLGIKHRKKVIKEIKKSNLKQLKLFYLFVLFLMILNLIIFEKLSSVIVALSLIAVSFGIALLYLIKIIERIAFIKERDVKNLVEGDWLVKNVIKNKKIICKVRNIGLTNKDLQILKKHKIKNVTIKEGIPFVPGFLAGYLITIFLGNILFIML